jgi:hypothetical protein
MSGWDIAVYFAGAVLIIGPVVVFIVYLKEMTRRFRENDLGPSQSRTSRGKEQ